MEQQLGRLIVRCSLMVAWSVSLREHRRLADSCLSWTRVLFLLVQKIREGAQPEAGVDLELNLGVHNRVGSGREVALDSGSRASWATLIEEGWHLQQRERSDDET